MLDSRCDTSTAHLSWPQAHVVKAQVLEGVLRVRQLVLGSLTQIETRMFALIFPLRGTELLTQWLRELLDGYGGNEAAR